MPWSIEVRAPHNQIAKAIDEAEPTRDKGERKVAAHDAQLNLVRKIAKQAATVEQVGDEHPLVHVMGGGVVPTRAGDPTSGRVWVTVQNVPE